MIPASNIPQEEAGNRHCCVVEIKGRGILIEGRPGSGKTSLAFGLLERAGQLGLKAALVCDDQALLAARDDKLYATAPEAIAGKAELRGFGIVTVPHKAETHVHVVSRLTADKGIERMPEAVTAKLVGIDVPLIEVPERHENQAVRIVLAWLGEGKLDLGT